MPVSGASFTFSNNIIGGVNDHSIQITSNNASNLLHGVLDNGGHNVSTITGNVIRNLVNTGGTGTGLNSSVIGIAGNKIFAGY
jgi:putative cofactor-binding repeat protein